MSAANPVKIRMNRIRLLSITSMRSGTAMPELLISTAITSVIIAGMMTATLALQKSASASYHHARSQLQQARLIDYIARDLRRALTVKVDTFQGAERLSLTIPDYYDSTGAARDPSIANGGIIYGSSGGSVPVSYYKSGGAVYRKVNDRPTTLATDVQQFNFDFTDDGQQAIGVSISFVPRYQFRARDTQSLREGTTTYATTLLRNKRVQ
jgi:Tfp pilus assembly protein PilW